MSDTKIPTPAPSDSGREAGTKKNKSLLKKILKISGISLGAIVALLLLVITIAVSYLKPERLTPLVEKYANSYLNADVNIGRMELSFWSTFPKLVVEVDTLSIKSKALDSLPSEVRAGLPVGADSLLSLQRLEASLNIFL